MTFTRSMSSMKRFQNKPKFRSVANVIRAGIMVDRYEGGMIVSVRPSMWHIPRGRLRQVMFWFAVIYVYMPLVTYYYIIFTTKRGIMHGGYNEWGNRGQARTAWAGGTPRENAR